MPVLADADINVIDMINKSRDNVAYNLIDIETPPSEGVIDRIEAFEEVLSVRVLEAA